MDVGSRALLALAAGSATTYYYYYPSSHVRAVASGVGVGVAVYLLLGLGWGPGGIGGGGGTPEHCDIRLDATGLYRNSVLIAPRQFSYADATRAVARCSEVELVVTPDARAGDYDTLLEALRVAQVPYHDSHAHQHDEGAPWPA